MASARINRRRFLQAGSAAGLGYLYTGPAASVAKAYRANDRVRVAGIGVGGKGSSDIDNAGAIMEVVALCDADETKLAPKAKKWPEAKTFSDFRKLFDAAGKSFDAATISTPDHTHAPAAARAIQMGKHVYVQKPLTHTVFEARTLRDLAKKHGVCTQMGNQGTAASGLRRAVELIQGGIIGQVKEIHVWTNRPIWPQAPKVTARPEPAKEVPKTVNWDAFLGPAPERPYAPGYHPFAWRGWLDFGTGALGDMACHTANMAFMACKLAYPTSVVADATDVNAETHPSSNHTTFEFPARGDMGPVTFHWYEGQRDGKKVLPPEALLAKVLKPNEKLSNSGSLLVGEKGILFSPNDYGADYRITPGELAEGKNLKDPEKLPVNNKGDQGMKDEWLEAIKAGKPSIAMSNFDYAAALTETILLGNIAARLTGQKLEWDGPSLKFTNNAKATALVTKEYRKGWDLMGTSKG